MSKELQFINGSGIGFTNQVWTSNLKQWGHWKSVLGPMLNCDFFIFYFFDTGLHQSPQRIGGQWHVNAFSQRHTLAPW